MIMNYKKKILQQSETKASNQMRLSKKILLVKCEYPQ